MRPARYDVDAIVSLLRATKIATMTQLKQALGSTVDITVTRKLQQLGYHTSYSHRGRYYTLDELVGFDGRGLWSYRSVRFSRFGTLVNTAEAFIAGSDMGYLSSELEDELQVTVKDALLNLVRQNRICREKLGGRYLYCSCDPVSMKRQLALRRGAGLDQHLLAAVAGQAVPEEVKAAIVLFFSLLDEKQRRLYAGLESLKYGHGGDRKIAGFLGMDVHTVAKGRREIFSQDVEVGRVRRGGGGRKPVEKKRRMSSGRSNDC